MSTFEICLTGHAVDRFHERVRPALSREAAEDELARLAPFGTVVSEPPPWLIARPRSLYLVVGDLVLPLVPCPEEGTYYATTCIARGGLSRFRRRPAHTRGARAQPRTALACAGPTAT